MTIEEAISKMWSAPEHLDGRMYCADRYVLKTGGQKALTKETGYIANALRMHLISRDMLENERKSREWSCEPNQKWHLFVSYIAVYMCEENHRPKYFEAENDVQNWLKYIKCPELFLWMLEACELVDSDKLNAACDEAIKRRLEDSSMSPDQITQMIRSICFK